jgi:hypothetical protein
MDRRESKNRDVRKAKAFFDLADLGDGVLEPVVAELLLFNVLECIVKLAVFVRGDERFPCRKNNRVLAGGMVLVHSRKAFEGVGKLGGFRVYLGIGCRQNVFGNFAPALVLGNENVRILGDFGILVFLF